MPTFTPYRVHCRECESENLDHVEGVCNECGYRPACPECFDTRTVPAPDLHITAMGTCGDCA